MARSFVQGLELTGSNEWRKFVNSGKIPDDIPSNPNKVYKDIGWVNMGDWLGTGTIASSKVEYKSFEEARSFVHSLKLKSQTDWFKWCKTGNRPADIPSNASRVYKAKGWVSWPDYLGTA